MPRGIYMKSAQNRGGDSHDINIHDVYMEEVPTAISVNLNYDSGTNGHPLPENMTEVPKHWQALLDPVPKDIGTPHFHNVKIWNVHAVKSKTAFQVESPTVGILDHFHFENILIEAQTAGTIQRVSDWSFVNVTVVATDGSKVKVTDSKNVTGLN